MVVSESLVLPSEDSFGNLLGTSKVVFSVGQDFWFNDRDEAVLLTDRSIASKNISDFKEGNVAWSMG